MERHTISILLLVAVTAMAFPILYSAQANENTAPRVLYQISALPQQTTKNTKTIELSAPTHTPWDIIQQEFTQSVETVRESTEKYIVKTPVPKVIVPSTPVQVSAPKKINFARTPVAVPEKQKVKKQPSVGFAETVRIEIQRLTDTERSRKNLALLSDSAKLTKIALEHSADMVHEDYFAHTTPDGCTLTCRFESAAYTATTWGENIASIEGQNIPTAKEVAQSFFEQWLQSSGHRKNILSAEYTHQGIGVVKQADAIYVTVNFSKPI